MDTITPRRRSENMRAIRSKDMAPELAVRRLVHGMGYRFRLHRKDLPGKPDLVFPSRRKVIFVHGCFWHQHSGCREGRVPGSRTEYWVPKLEKNHLRDEANKSHLEEEGWKVLIIWECELRDIVALEKKVKLFLKRPGA